MPPTSPPKNTPKTGVFDSYTNFFLKKKIQARNLSHLISARVQNFNTF